jgi:hypothetical protein
VGTYAGERPRVCMSAHAQVWPGRTGPRSGVGVCGQKVGGTAVAMAQRQQHVHDKGHKQGDGKRGSAHHKGLCSPDSWPKKGRAFTRRWCVQRVGIDGEPEPGVRSSGQRYDTIARQGSARGDDGSGTCKATGSARWLALKRRRVCAAARHGTAGDTHTASAQGSVQPRLDGRVHNKVKGFLTSRSGLGGEAAVTSSGTA